MKKLILASLIAATSFTANAADIKFGSFVGMAESTDAFGDSVGKVHEVRQGYRLYFNCRQMTIDTSSQYSSHEYFSFGGAQIALKFDNGKVLNEVGKYSTYKYGSDMVNDGRFYTFNLYKNIAEEMKAANSVTIAMKASFQDDWTYRTVKLNGFTNAINSMCK